MNAKPWQSKIVGHEQVAPDSLLAHPGNWRIHPKHQQDALAGVIGDIGFIKSVTVNRTTDHVLDGHLRVALALRDNVPLIDVEYVELTEAEELEALATLDPLSALAGTDAAQLDALLREVSTGDSAVQALLDELAQAAGIVPPGADLWDAAMGGLPTGDKGGFQQMTFTISDEQAATIKRAITAAQAFGPFVDTGNENSNGNALARICEAYHGC